MILSIHFWAVSAEKITPFHGLTAKSIDGADVTFSAYKGQVVLVVNTASKCGYTSQYGGLEKLYQEFRAKGFVVLGFPSDDFGGQEPGSEKEIKKFCEGNFGVTFPLFSKVKILGPLQSPVYRTLIGGAVESRLEGGDVSWNFEKFLVGPDGKVIGRFKSRITPESKELRQAISQALSSK